MEKGKQLKIQTAAKTQSSPKRMKVVQDTKSRPTDNEEVKISSTVTFPWDSCLCQYWEELALDCWDVYISSLILNHFKKLQALYKLKGISIAKKKIHHGGQREKEYTCSLKLMKSHMVTDGNYTYLVSPV